MEQEIAILLAAGTGSRMLPLTNDVPKPLIKVGGVPMIETIINGFIHRGVKEIYIVVGYKKCQFDYLTKKYKNVKLVENKEYQTKNNISSFYASNDIIGSYDCFICDADLYIKNSKIFDGVLKTSCFFCKYIEGETKEWVFKVKNGYITKICVGGNDDYNLVGISYWKKEDVIFLKEMISNAYQEKGHESLFWEEVANLHLDSLDVAVHPVSNEYVAEIDTLEELREMDSSYI